MLKPPVRYSENVTSRHRSKRGWTLTELNSSALRCCSHGLPLKFKGPTGDLLDRRSSTIVLPHDAVTTEDATRPNLLFFSVCSLVLFRLNMMSPFKTQRQQFSQLSKHFSVATRFARAAGSYPTLGDDCSRWAFNTGQTLAAFKASETLSKTDPGASDIKELSEERVKEKVCRQMT